MTFIATVVWKLPELTLASSVPHSQHGHVGRCLQPNLSVKVGVACSLWSCRRRCRFPRSLGLMAAGC